MACPLRREPLLFCQVVFKVVARYYSKGFCSFMNHHGVYFYQRDIFLINHLVQFAKEGLDKGEPLLFITTTDHRRVERRGLAVVGYCGIPVAAAPLMHPEVRIGLSPPDPVDCKLLV